MKTSHYLKFDTHDLENMIYRSDPMSTPNYFFEKMVSFCLHIGFTTFLLLLFQMLLF